MKAALAVDQESLPSSRFAASRNDAGRTPSLARSALSRENTARPADKSPVG